LIHAVELIFIAGSALLIWQLPEIRRPDYLEQHVFSVAFIMLLYSGLTNWAGLNRINALVRLLRHADALLVSVVVAHITFMAIVRGLDVGYMFAQWWFVYLLAGTAVSVLAVRTAAVLGLGMMARRRVIGRNLAVLGTGEQTRRFLSKITHDEPCLTNLVGVFSASTPDSDRLASGVPILGDMEALLRAARDGCVDDIVVAMPWSADQKVIDTIEQLKELPVNVYLASDLVGFDLGFRPDIGSFGHLPVFEVVQRPITGWGGALKRLMDFVLALMALILLFPFFLLVAIAIRLDSAGPVFFMQKRLGFNNRPFAIFKFRSMHHNCAPVAQVVQTTRNDPRVTRVGRFIRATSIDELPQLLNVLDGSMSLVGPRPHALSHNEEYGAQIRGYFARHKVRPGITGWAQVNGYRGETEQLDKMVKRVEHDVYYADNWSVLFDIKILIMTALVVLFQRSAY
jgi:Undecaprenyl-phosphate glucose phosphotransferase